MPLSSRFALAALLLLTACGSAQSTRFQAASQPLPEGVVTSDRGPGDARLPQSAQKLIRNARLVLEVGSDEEVATALEGARTVTESLDGYVSWEGPGAMTLRIPDSDLEDALDRIGALGAVDRREIRSQDVTASYTDLQIRLDNALALQTRLRALLSQAETVADIVEVESALSRATLEVERLEGQKRLLDNQISFSTVRFEVYDGATPGPLGWVVVGLYNTVKWLFVWE